jgi:hypothetical protein
MPGPADAGTATWLVLVYKLPAKPAGLKATVHRKLTAAGAVYLSRACAAAPAGPAERVMRRMRAMIAAAGGSALLLRGCALLGGPEMTAAFNAARDREYDDIIARCRAAVASVEAMIAAGDFRCEHLSDIDAGLKQQDACYLAVGEHDVLGAGKAREAASALARYRSVVDEYATRLFAADNGP